ncbi:hypothetical protein CENSYa_0494 [Cenarchaeum symbiosum A]|uniref:Uncharacterized protein n=1 Tax=Cenarchaeum symbiosum (strain A) TaxID=414004 RepID=A0RUW0_CENSY|nr:hypothetical protein CENSYa_0494 [Cenarchaeum symbiosum A]
MQRVYTDVSGVLPWQGCAAGGLSFECPRARRRIPGPASAGCGGTYGAGSYMRKSAGSFYASCRLG